MKWIKDKMILWQLQKKLSAKNPRTVKAPLQLRCMGILASSEEEFNRTKAIIRDLWHYNVRIIGLFYSEERSSSIEAISSGNFTAWGLPSDHFNEFLTEKMDFILVPSINLNPYLRYLLLVNQSTFNIGFYSESNVPYLDLMMEMQNEDLMTNIHHLIDYLLRVKEAC